MKTKLLFLFAILVGTHCPDFFGMPIQAQEPIDLEVVWQKEVFPKEINDAHFSANGQWIYAAIGNTIEKISAETGEFVSIFDKVDSAFIYQLTSMNISNYGNYIVTTNGNGAVVVWDTRTEKKIKQIQIGVSAVSITADEKYLLIASQRPDSYGVIVYDMLTDQQERVIPVNRSISLIKVSHDGKYFTTGGWYEDKWEGKFYDQVILWSTETWTPVDTIETLEGVGSGYKYLKFSSDDKYLGCVRLSPSDARIHNILDKTTPIESNNKCSNIEFLPQDYFLIYYFGLNLELHNLFSKINSYNILATITDISLLDNKYKILCCGGDYPMTMLKNKLVGVETPLIEKENINIFQIDNQIIIETKNIYYPSLNIEIYNLQGNLIYSELLAHNSPSSKYNLDIKLSTGTYICNVKTDNKIYSQKIVVVK